MTFLVLKADYPHGSAANNLFSVNKGEIMECPSGYKPSSCFSVFNTIEQAEAFLKDQAEDTTQPNSQEERVDNPSPSFPLFRKISTSDGDTEYQLFQRDIYRFLARHENEVLLDLKALAIHHATAKRLLAYERKHFTRKPIMAFLEGILKGEEKDGDENTEKPPVVKKPKGATTPETSRKLSP